jgi:hypothetical protein
MMSPNNNIKGTDSFHDLISDDLISDISSDDDISNGDVEADWNVKLANPANHVTPPSPPHLYSHDTLLDVYPYHLDGTIAPNYVMVMNSKGGHVCKEALLDMHDKLQSLFYCGKAKPVPICLESCARKYLSPATSEAVKFDCFETLMTCCGCYEGKNKFFNLHPKWPRELFPGEYEVEQPYPMSAMKLDGRGGILCTYMVTTNMVDGELEIVPGKYYDPANIGDMARAGEVIPLPEFMLPMIAELNEMKEIGGGDIFREYCNSFFDIPKNFPEGSPVATYHLCQLHKAIQGRLVR